MRTQFCLPNGLGLTQPARLSLLSHLSRFSRLSRLSRLSCLCHFSCLSRLSFLAPLRFRLLLSKPMEYAADVCTTLCIRLNSGVRLQIP